MMKPLTTILFFLTLCSSVVTSWAADAPSPAPTTRTNTREAIIARYTDSATKFIDLDGVNVHYKDEGAGTGKKVVLLVHGTLGDLTDWDEWVKVLKTDYRVVRLDLPGFGLSGEIPSGNYSIERIHSLIDALMDSLQIERFAIAGISYGGPVSFRYAATRTDRVTALILMNSAGIETGRRVTAIDKPNVPTYNITTDPVVTKDNIADFYKGYVNDPSKVTPALLQRKTDFLNINTRVKEAIATLKQYERGNPERLLAHVRAPALVLWGDANNALQTQTADAFVAALKNACSVQRIIYKGAGHMINLDQPQETVKDVKAFLDKLPGACVGRKP